MYISNETAAYSERKGFDFTKKEKMEKKKKCILFILVPLITVFIIGLIVGLIFLIKHLKNKDSDQEKEDEKQEEKTEKIISPIEPENDIQYKKLEKEFEITTTVGELKRVLVIQKSIDEIKKNGKSYFIKVLRKTNYDIYIISEEEADEDNNLFYSKMYTAAISIVSECSSVGQDDCEPEKIVDLTVEKKNKNNNSRVRILNSIEDYRDLPIPICIFNITDNDFITVISCPESFPDTKKNEILLDLYFFRPPAIERADKNKDNITVTIIEDKDNNKKYIHEINGGLCNIYDSIGSLCTTDMNTTTDLEGKLLKYDEYAVTNIPNDENNGYIKIKETHLVDISDNIKNLDPVKYKKSLEKLLPKLEPYMKEDIQFTRNNFNELYNVVHKKRRLETNNNIKKHRNLFELAISNGQNLIEANLFNYIDPGGINVNYDLIDDPGLEGEQGGDLLKIFSRLKFDNESRELVYLDQISNITYIIDKLSVLSKAGNRLATELYNNLNEKLNNITNDISLKISELNEIIKYYDLTEIFGSKLSLSLVRNFSKDIIYESDNLLNKLFEIYNGIKIGNIRDITDNLNLLVHNYILNSHSLLKNVFDNLKDLGDILKSINNKLTEITTYYLNYTTYSYYNTVENASNFLENYYINEKNIILSEVEKLINIFEESMNETLINDINNINILIENLKNKTYNIESATEEEYDRLILNLNNSKNYILDITKKIKDFINEEIGLKSNGYFISDYDIISNNNSYSYVIKESKEISRKLDNDEYIDKLFDEKMRNFKENCTKIINYMEKAKFQNFVLDEDILETSLFNNRDNINNKMTDLRAKIINKINEENNYYLENLEKNISEFMKVNLSILNHTISDLDTIYFSEYSLKILRNSFENAFNSCLTTLLTDIKENELLAKNYFNNLYNIINNDNYLYQLLSSYKVNEIPNSRYFGKILRYFKIFEDQITSKEKTSAYLYKYNEYMANFEYSKTYITNQLYLDILNEYKPIIIKLKEKLQTIKDNKITEKFPDFRELHFYNNHKNTIDEILKRFDLYFSDNEFNNHYLTKLNQDKNNDIKYIDSVKNYINSKHNVINKLNLNYDNSNDFCIRYKRKLCYGCPNCVWNTYVDDIFCFPLSSDIKNNHLYLIKSKIKDDPNLANFKVQFEDFYNKLNEQINIYNSNIQNLEKRLNYVKEDTLNREITEDYLTPFANWVNSILYEKYGEKIIKASYNYYKEIIKNRLVNILNDVSNQWNDCFDNLISEVDKNYENFTSTTYEFGIMAQAYYTLITQNITQSYTDSIILFQKNEFNYTISYYYNYFIKVVNEAYKFVFNNIPINENGFSDILNIRKREISDNFNNFINIIKQSNNEAKSIKNQKSILQISEEDFFDIDSEISDIIINLTQSLKNKYIRLYDYERIGDQYSVVSRYFLENSESGKQISQFYSAIDGNSFVDLSLYKYKDILLDNWIFDKYDFISKLKESLLNLTKDLEKDIESHNKTHTITLENEITKFLKDSIENKICDFFSSEIKDLNANDINNINLNINKIINKINEIMIYESNRLKTTLTSYNNDFSKIENFLKEYKNKIFDELNTTIFSVLDGFYQNIIQNVYINYIENSLNDYIKEAKKETSTNDECKEYPLLTSSYKIGKMIEENLENIIQKYKEKTKKIIDFQYQQYYVKIKQLIKLDEIKEYINYQIENTYQNNLKKALNASAINDQGNDLYLQYEFNTDQKSQIQTIFNESMVNIKTLILSTKGSNYGVNIYLASWEKMSFGTVSYKVIKPICKSLYKYCNSEKLNQDSIINDLILEKIYSNFNNLLNDVIPTFGEAFFERIIKYNENFKISALYDNLRFSLTETLLYYISLKLTSDVEALPKDLKIRLFNLNDLDLTVETKNKIILKDLDKKATDFITESSISIIEKYIKYLTADDDISKSFNYEVLKAINDSLILAKPTISNNYKIMLDKYLKERLITSYAKVMNDKTNKMINFVNEKKITLKSKLSSFFSLDSDQVLIDVNTKINNTLEAIKKYNESIFSFEIPNNTYIFFKNYGFSYILPQFKNLRTILIKASKDKIINNLEQNSKNIQNLNSEQFNTQINNNIKFFNINYIQNFTNSINSYGTNNYSSHLIRQMKDKKEKLRRRLDGTQTEEDLANDSRERITDQGIEENFLIIINLLNNIKSNLYTLDAFNQLDNKINNNIQKLDEKYKESKMLIEENEYEEEIKNYLNEKLSNLTNIEKEYYKKINESYYKLRNYLNKSIEETYTSINNCSKITYSVFNSEFDKIVNNINPFNIEHSKLKDKLDTIVPYFQLSDHKTNVANTTIFDLKEFGEFKFDILYKNDSIKKLIIIATIINRSRPNKANIDIKYPYSYCVNVLNQLDIEFNEANYTMKIFYDSEENKINLTMFTFFEQYEYYMSSHLINGTISSESADTGDNEMDIPIKCKNIKNQTLIPRNGTIVDEKNNKSFIILNI